MGIYHPNEINKIITLLSLTENAREEIRLLIHKKQDKFTHATGGSCPLATKASTVKEASNFKSEVSTNINSVNPFGLGH